MIKTHGLNHISLSVRDPDVSLAFYTKLFGVREYLEATNSIPPRVRDRFKPS